MHLKRLVIASETDDSQRFDEARIKDLTGNDTISARHLYGNPFDFKPTHKLMMYGNHKPTVKGTDEGIWRRMRLIPFDVTIPKEKVDPHLTDKLEAELPGILAWAVNGCLRWQSEGLEEPEIVRARTEEYRAENDTVQFFIEECCVVHPDAKVASSVLYERYQEWVKTMGTRPLSIQKLGRDLKRRGFEDTKFTGGQRGFRGIGLLKTTLP
jgi:putative DNA primase/helicase